MTDTGDPLDSLPGAVLADVLSRVADAADIAACRLSSRALLSASYHCPRIRLAAAARRGRRGGSALRMVAGNLASLLGPHLRSLALDASGGWDGVGWLNDAEVDEADDLHITSGEAVTAWAATAAGRALRELKIADYWPQSCWRKADALPLISLFCQNLVKLELRNAWLSVDGLEIMPKLTHLTLQFIRLDDEDLTKLNECFPCLQILNLIRVGGLKEPKIHLPQLKACYWEVSNVPRSLAIHAPNLVDLELNCARPDVLILDTPCLSTLKLTISKLGGTVQVDGIVSLTNLRIESLNQNSLLPVFVDNRAISTLELELPYSANHFEPFEDLNPDYLLPMFASISEVKLGPRFSRELLKYLVCCTNSQFPTCLMKLLVHLPPSDNRLRLVPLLNICAPSCEVTILFHADSADATCQLASSTWMAKFPMIRWQWCSWR